MVSSLLSSLFTEQDSLAKLEKDLSFCPLPVSPSLFSNNRRGSTTRGFFLVAVLVALRASECRSADRSRMGVLIDWIFGECSSFRRWKL
ncbi:hypothetical protein KFK09_027932 [Dendrobium nobile]|uniref:Uncharacterized protein n=1 Tax=Dendrobium nobile TaxID=94219 RepID=A0A8T3A0G3_DENNO|nr:hypothetical protein KFK09_027932 [Dendrobium nobile]